MRIRKHAKVSPLTYFSAGDGAAALHRHNCQLNQSPWDVFSSPPPPNHVDSPSLLLLPPPLPLPPPPPFDACESYPQNASFDDSNEASQSVESAVFSSPTAAGDFSGRAAAACGGYSPDRREAIERPDIYYHNSIAQAAEAEAEVKKSEKLTPPLLQPTPAVVAEEAGAMSRPGRRPRVKKPSISSNNPYDELYYYTGFGPLWGKKRGPGRASATATATTATITTTRNGFDSTSAEQDRGNGTTTSSISEAENGEFDYVEDEFEEDDEDGESEDGMRKKARKPIKARSLKSLM